MDYLLRKEQYLDVKIKRINIVISNNAANVFVPLLKEVSKSLKSIILDFSDFFCILKIIECQLKKHTQLF